MMIKFFVFLNCEYCIGLEYLFVFFFLINKINIYTMIERDEACTITMYYFNVTNRQNYSLDIINKLVVDEVGPTTHNNIYNSV